MIFLALFRFFRPIGSLKAFCQWGTYSIKGRSTASQSVTTGMANHQLVGRPDQFLDHLTVIKISDFKKTYLIHQLYHGVKTIKGTHWLWTSNLLQNEIEKLPLMVSQLPPVVPTWSNLVQFDFQQKHPDPAKDSPLHRGSSTKCAYRGWLCIAQRCGYP